MVSENNCDYYWKHSRHNQAMTEWTAQDNTGSVINNVYVNILAINLLSCTVQCSPIMTKVAEKTSGDARHKKE